jgi:hypothetical protein
VFWCLRRVALGFVGAFLSPGGIVCIVAISPLVADLPSRFWKNASNFRELSECLLHFVATIISSYNNIFLAFIL